MARRLVLASALLAFALGGAPPLAAQLKAPAPAAALEAPAPPYDEQLLRLSEILGAVHYLRQLCGKGEGNAWRDEMEKLIETEQPDDARRAQMVDRFNRGYEGYRAVYLSCTPAATEASDRYLKEGAKIAGEITARYGR